MNNLDTIDVIYTESTHTDGTVLEDISLVLNGETIPGVFDAFVFACSGAMKRFEIELMTCSCGHAGCAGIFYGTKVKRRRYTVEWRDIDCGFPKRFYNFDGKAYDAAIAKTFQFMLDLATKREARGRGDDEYGGALNFWSVADLEQCITYSTRWMKNYKIQ